MSEFTKAGDFKATKIIRRPCLDNNHVCSFSATAFKNAKAPAEAADSFIKAANAQKANGSYPYIR